MNLNVKLSTELGGSRGPAKNLGESWPAYPLHKNHHCEQSICVTIVYSLHALSSSHRDMTAWVYRADRQCCQMVVT